MGIKTKAIALCTVFSVAAGCLGGCDQAVEAWVPADSNHQIKIALLGTSEYFHSDNGILDAMDMACEDLLETTGYSLTYETYDDEGDYNKGVMLASEIAADNSISVAVSMQDFEIIDTVASIFESAEKPFVVTQGCYDDTSEKGYQYLITDFVSANTVGKILGNYSINQGYQRVAYCHTNTQYEKDSLKGFQSVVKTSKTSICDTVIGPFTQEEFDSVYEVWRNLEVDAVCISVYSLTLGGEIARMLQEKGSDIAVLTDYSIDNDETIQKNGAYLNDTVIVPLYPYQVSQAYLDFSARFTEKYGYEPSSAAIQSYDLGMLLGNHLTSGVTTPSQLMEKLKSDQGYAGVSGTIKFNSNGTLVVDNGQVFAFLDGKFRAEGS